MIGVHARNNWECALAEAAFMTGLERNGDVLRMAAYAPPSAHMDAWQWTPNLIWFDNLRVYGTPNYYVQQLFSRNSGDVVLPIAALNVPTAPNGQPRLYASATQDDAAREIVIKVVNATSSMATVRLKIDGAELAPEGTITTLAANLADENSLDAPTKVAPATLLLRGIASEFSHEFRSNSLTVFRLNVGKQR